MIDYSNINLQIRKLILQTKDVCNQWIGRDEFGDTVLFDPIEHKPIRAHYAMTHYSAALILLGINEENKQDLEIGLSILEGIIRRWKDDLLQRDFHFDFNNFALCIIHDSLKAATGGAYSGIVSDIESILIKTADSNHFTINWLPMRMYVNIKRYNLTSDNKYLKRVDKLMNMIRKATYKDGFIDDRLPKGKSFNLQYDIATVAILQFMNRRGSNYDISANIKALINVVAPDGDINYIGRGCNQIFAWGLWIYLAKSINVAETLQLGLNYLSNYLPTMLKNNNIFLNYFDGDEQFLWWDYHYSSVYTAHLLLWLTISLYETPNKEEFMSQNPEFHSDSGVKALRDDDYFAVLFSGRNEYLAEKGPVIANLCLSQYGTISKGSFGPWKGAFGNKFLENTCVIRNYLGPIIINMTDISEEFKLGLPTIDINKDEQILTIEYKFPTPKMAIFNIPLLKDSVVHDEKIKIIADHKEVRLTHIGNLKNQYGFISIYQTKPRRTRTWKMKILL